MLKSFVIGFLFGVALAGFGLYFIGRGDLDRVEQNFESVRRDLEPVRGTVDELQADIAGLTEDITDVNRRAGEATERITDIAERHSENTQQLGLVSGKVDDVYAENTELVQLSGEFDDIGYDLRRLTEKVAEAGKP